MSVADLLKSLSDAFTNRLKSPLIGGFVLSFLAYNWKALAYFYYSTEEIGQRIQIIEDVYLSLDSYVVPVVVVLFYSVSIELINYWLDVAVDGPRGKRIDLRNKRELSAVDHSQKLADKQLALENTRARHEDIQKLNDEISDLGGKVAQKDSELKELKEGIKVKGTENEELKTQLAKFKKTEQELSRARSKLTEKEKTIADDQNRLIQMDDDLKTQKKRNGELKTELESFQKGNSNVSDLLLAYKTYIESYLHFLDEGNYAVFSNFVSSMERGGIQYDSLPKEISITLVENGLISIAKSTKGSLVKWSPKGEAFKLLYHHYSEQIQNSK